MSSVVAASLRRILIANQHPRLLISIQNHRPFSMQYKDTEKPPHPFDYVNKNYSKKYFSKSKILFQFDFV
jgi:hypothetical protein